MATRMMVDTAAIRTRHPHPFGRPSRARQLATAIHSTSAGWDATRAR